MGCVSSSSSKSTTKNVAVKNEPDLAIKPTTSSTKAYVYKTPTRPVPSTPSNSPGSASPSGKRKRPKKLKLMVDTSEASSQSETKLARKTSLDGSIIKESLQIIHTPKPSETKIVNQYRWMSKFPVGTGTSAKVFVVEDLDRSRLVAMKVVNKSLLKKMSINFEASYRSDGFKREMAVLKRLRHPNIVRLYEVIDDPKHNLLYLALEYFDGGDLGDSSIPTPSIKEDVAKRWSRDILEALRYCHDNNVVHRDLKTENILKVKDGSRVALVDFGMSHMWNRHDVDTGGNGKDNKSFDKLKKAMGTFYYFAPEILKDKYGTDTKKKGRQKSRRFKGKPIDIWAFGVVLYKLMRGVVPYFDENRVQTLRLIANADPSNDLDLQTGFSQELSRFFLGVLNVDPKQRLTAEEALNHEWLKEIITLTPLKPRDTSVIDSELDTVEIDGAISTLSFSQVVFLKTKARRLAIKAREHAAIKIQTPIRTRLARAKVARIRKENEMKFEKSYKKNVSKLKKSQSLYSLKGDRKESFGHLGNVSHYGRSNSVNENIGKGVSTYLPAIPDLNDTTNLIKLYRGPTETSNWLIRGRIMVGSSPGTHIQKQTKYTKKNALKEIKLLRENAGVTTFVSLQQVNESLKFKPMYHTLLKKVYTANERGNVPQETLGDSTHNGKTSMAGSTDAPLMRGRSLPTEPTFIRQPVVDGMVMADEDMIKLIKRLTELFNKKEILYLHCYGGHGRAGTVASLLLATIYGLAANDAMEHVQKYHDTRVWTENSESPASEVQRLQVRRLLASGDLV